MPTKKNDDDTRTSDALIAAMLAAPSLAKAADIIGMPGKAFRTCVRAEGTYVGGSRGDDARALTSDTLAAVLARPSVRKHAEAAGYVFGE